VNAWSLIEKTIVSLSSVTKDSPAVSYKVLYSVYGTSPDVVYQIVSDVGSISGSASFPFASAQADFTDTYNIFFGASPVSDKVATYRVLNYVEDVRTEYYRILNAVTRDVTPQYNSGGSVTQDTSLAYNVVSGVTRDSTATYQVKVSAQQDSSTLTYSITTTPLTAGDNRTLTYNVVSAITVDSLSGYRILGSALTDAVVTYQVRLGAQQDGAVVYDINSSVFTDQYVTYQLVPQATATLDAAVVYSVVARVNVVPNIIGFPLPKAKKVLEQHGFVLGQVTYN
jgi:hypothetical protein